MCQKDKKLKGLKAAFKPRRYFYAWTIIWLKNKGKIAATFFIQSG